MNSALDLLTLAIRAAEQAADYLRTVERPQDPQAWGIKGHRDFVTEVDRTSERIITNILTQGEPGSTVVGEELQPTMVDGGLVWVVDPLDGTTNFLHGYPQFAVSIGAAVDGVLQAGVVLHVSSGSLFRASRGGGTWLGGARLQVSTIRDPGMALVGTGFPFKHIDQLEAFQRQLAVILSSTSGVRRAGSAALDLADVAAGRFEGFWELRLAPWDIAAGLLLVREAGGVVTDTAGREIGIEHTGVVAGNPWIHEWLLKVMAND